MKETITDKTTGETTSALDNPRFNELLTQLDSELATATDVSHVTDLIRAFEEEQVVQQVINAYASLDKARAYGRNVNQLFQKHAPGIYARSGFANATIVKRFGYPGDFEVLEAVYSRKSFAGTTPQGEFFDQWAYHTQLPEGVRGRKDALREVLSKYIQEGKRNILSIASGSGKEIRELPADVLEQAHFDMLDHDPNSYDFFSKAGSDVSRKNSRFLQSDAFKLNVDLELKSYDIIYSFGLYDYIGDGMVGRSIQSALPALKDDGLVLYAIKDINYYPAWLYAFFCDWHFVPRNAQQGKDIAEQNNLKVVDTIITDGDTVNIYICKKK